MDFFATIDELLALNSSVEQTRTQPSTTPLHAQLASTNTEADELEALQDGERRGTGGAFAVCANCTLRYGAL